MTTDYDFSLELKTFKTMLPELLFDNIGKHAVICGDKLLGIMVAYEDALKLGYGAVGIATPFLVKQILIVEDAVTFTRDHFPKVIVQADPMFMSPEQWAQDMAKRLHP